MDNIGSIYEWVTTTPLGMAALVGVLIVLFTLIAVLYERRTRKLYPDRNRRGTKATAKAKAKKAAAKKAAKENSTLDDAEGVRSPQTKQGGTSSDGAITRKKSGATTSKTKKKAAEEEPEDDEEGFGLEGLLGALWGDEKTGEKGLFEKMWDSHDDEDDDEADEEESQPKPKKKPQKNP